MNWFKMYTEARNDAKLRTLTDSQHRIWFHLLCLAAEQNDNGVITFRNQKLLAIEVSESDVEKLQDALSALHEIGIIEITDNAVEFPGFTKRQAKPKDSPEANRERQKRYRERHKEEGSNTVTDSNDRYGVTNNEEENRTEENRLEESNAVTPRVNEHLEPIDIESDLAEAVKEICKVPLLVPPKQRPQLESTLRGLIAENATPEQVREFGRKCHDHWCGQDKHTKKPRAPAVSNVHRCWREVLSLPEPDIKTDDEPQFDIEELRARARNHHHANRN